MTTVLDTTFRPPSGLSDVATKYQSHAELVSASLETLKRVQGDELMSY